MASHHEPLAALASIDWADVPRADADLGPFLGAVFADAQAVVDSIPSPSGGPLAAATGRARAKTDSVVAYGGGGPHGEAPRPSTSSRAAAAADKLRGEWREVRVNARENPLDISVFKLAARDGRGTWFARRSVHDGLAFEGWRAGLAREFAEAIKVQGPPGSGSVRGIGAERSVERRAVDGAGNLGVFQLSAQFPGPTSPRDFITLLLTRDSHSGQPGPHAAPLRQFMMVSKPCLHPDCPPRQGIIRGQYESVEVVREIAVDAAAAKRSLSHTDLGSHDARPAAGDADADATPRAIEWLMVTRSDPGGSVPRFMIDKGTPMGIVGDAGKFLKWAASSASPAAADGDDALVAAGHADDEGPPAPAAHAAPAADAQQPDARPQQAPAAAARRQDAAEDEGIPSSNGLYGVIAGAFGAATSVAIGLRQQFSSPLGFGGSTSSSISSSRRESVSGEDRWRSGAGSAMDDVDVDGDGHTSDASSARSFASAPERYHLSGGSNWAAPPPPPPPPPPAEPAPHGMGKELRRLAERRHKLDQDYSREQQRLESKRQGDADRDASAAAKALRRHERELAKHEARFRRELRRLDEKREQGERKAEARRRKAEERDRRSSLRLDLDRARAERDVALRQAELLQAQVGELQRENTMLVARLGRLGLGPGMASREASSSSSSRELSIRSQGRR